jgi:hypothetical protein
MDLCDLYDPRNMQLFLPRVKLKQMRGFKRLSVQSGTGPCQHNDSCPILLADGSDSPP